MRDQRRVEDDYKGDDHRRARIHGDRRQRSPALRKRQGGVDIGVKIKGRATADRDRPSSPKPKDSTDKYISQREENRKPNHSTYRRHNRGKPTKRSHRLDGEATTDRHKYRDNFNTSVKRKRSRSNSLHKESHDRRVGRDRSRSPLRPGRADRLHRPTSRHRGRSRSPLLDTRADNYLASHNDTANSAGRLARDLYVPSSQSHRPRSTTPQLSRNTSTAKNHFSSTSRRHRREEESQLHSYQTSPRGRAAGEEAESASARYHQIPRSQEPSPHRRSSHRYYRRGSRSPSPANSRRKHQGRKGSHTHVESRRSTGKSKKMQSTTRPIQSILDESPHPPSPPRPIPSFDSDSHDSGGVREVFPMHGMKANDVHGAIRQGRPQQIDTRQSYSTSPQWTPTSSHHGSPQSGSPFSHGRGGWGGQPQNFHGQSG